MEEQLEKACQQAIKEREKAKDEAMAKIAGLRTPVSPFKDGSGTVAVSPPKPEELPVNTLAKEALTTGAVKALQEDDVQIKIQKTGKDMLNLGIDKEVNKLQKDVQETAYDANSEACDNTGINRGSPKWAVDWAKFENNIWMCIWLIVSFLTVLPISLFSKGLKKVLKNSWIAILLAVIVWLIIITAPVWGTWLGRNT
jgi:hypothetical protein